MDDLKILKQQLKKEQAARREAEKRLHLIQKT